jgi:hypothetical protein
MGDMRDSHPRRQCHRLQCCCYTNVSITLRIYTPLDRFSNYN